MNLAIMVIARYVNWRYWTKVGCVCVCGGGGGGGYKELYECGPNVLYVLILYSKYWPVPLIEPCCSLKNPLVFVTSNNLHCHDYL